MSERIVKEAFPCTMKINVIFKMYGDTRPLLLSHLIGVGESCLSWSVFNQSDSDGIGSALTRNPRQDRRDFLFPRLECAHFNGAKVREGSRTCHVSDA